MSFKGRCVEDAFGRSWGGMGEKLTFATGLLLLQKHWSFLQAPQLLVRPIANGVWLGGNL